MVNWLLTVVAYAICPSLSILDKGAIHLPFHGVGRIVGPYDSDIRPVACIVTLYCLNTPENIMFTGGCLKLLLMYATEI